MLITIGRIDTAQAYLNQEEVGEALKRANFKRSDVFLTTKFSGRDGLSILDAANDSLRKVNVAQTPSWPLLIATQLSVDYVDLYLVHAPSLVRPDILGGWRQMEALQARGIAKLVTLQLSLFSFPRNSPQLLPLGVLA